MLNIILTMYKTKIQDQERSLGQRQTITIKQYIKSNNYRREIESQQKRKRRSGIGSGVSNGLQKSSFISKQYHTIQEKVNEILLFARKIIKSDFDFIALTNLVEELKKVCLQQIQCQKRMNTKQLSFGECVKNIVKTKNKQKEYTDGFQQQRKMINPNEQIFQTVIISKHQNDKIQQGPIKLAKTQRLNFDMEPKIKVKKIFEKTENDSEIIKYKQLINHNKSFNQIPKTRIQAQNYEIKKYIPKMAQQSIVYQRFKKQR